MATRAAQAVAGTETQRPPTAAQAQPSEPDQPAAAPGRRLIGAGELTSAIAALALLILLFATKWYGVAGVPDPSAARPAVSTAINGWHGLTIVRWVVLLTVIVAVGSVLLHISQRRHGSKTDTSRLVSALGALTSIVLIYRVLVSLPSSDRVIDQKLGAVLGLACALIIAVAGRQSRLEQGRPAPAAAAEPGRRRAAGRRRKR